MKLEITYKNIWNVAYPMILGSLSNSLLNVVDTAFVGRLGAVALGATAIGATYYLIFSLLCIGLASGAQIVIARRFGAKEYPAIGEVFIQNGYLMTLFGLGLLLLLEFSTPTILRAIISSDQIYTQTIAFTSYRSWGIVFVALYSIYSSFYIGISRTKVLSYAMMIMTGVNIVLDYGLVFGNLHMPNMGISGAALASAIAEFSSFLFIVIYTRYQVDAKQYKLYHFTRWKWNLVLKNISLGYPIMFQYLMSLGSWFMFFIIIEKLGSEALAVSNILRSLLLLFMMPVWGLSTTANTFTSNLLGQGKSSAIPLLLRKLLTIASVLVLLFAPFVFFAPQFLAQIYSDDSHLIAEASKIIWLVYLTMFTFIPGVILNNTLSGTGDTKSAFVIELISTMIYLFYAYLVAIYFGLPIVFIWGSELLYWMFIGFFSYHRLKSRKWKSINV
jgi:putative MATE family efflux protein